MALDPTTLVASAYWRVSYPGSPPWNATSTAGTSGTTGALVTNGSDPTSGTALNGFVPARFTAASSQLLINATDISSLVTTTAATIVGLIYVTSAIAPTGSIYNDTGIVVAASGDFGVTITSDGIGVFGYDGTYRLATETCASGAWHAFRARFDGVNLDVTIDNNPAGAPVACGTLTSLTGSLLVGSAYAGASFYNGDIRELMILPSYMSDSTWETYGQYYQAEYNLDLGFGAGLTATLDQTIAPVTLSSEATNTAAGTITAVLAQTIAPVTLSATATTDLTAALTETIAPVTLSSEATIAGASVEASLVQTIAPVTLSSFATNPAPAPEIKDVGGGGLVDDSWPDELARHEMLVAHELGLHEYQTNKPVNIERFTYRTIATLHGEKPSELRAMVDTFAAKQQVDQLEQRMARLAIYTGIAGALLYVSKKAFF